MTKKLKDMSMCRNAIKLSGLNEALRTLINAIFQETDNITVFGVGKKVKDFFNHGYDKDPNTNGGAVPTGVTVLIYYQPASMTEYNNYDTIDEAGFLSGRRRLAVRIEDSGYPSHDQLFSFYLTNHPREKPGLRTNVYGVFTPIDPAK